MKPIDQWQDGDELRLPTGETVTVRSVSDDGDLRWSVPLPNGAVANVYPDLARFGIEVHDGRDGPLTVYWTDEGAELGYVPLCVCGQDGCNDSTLAFGAANASVWFQPDAALRVLAVLAQLPRANTWRREEDDPADQPGEPVWLGVLDEAGTAVLQRRARVERDDVPTPLYETVGTRALDELVAR